MLKSVLVVAFLLTAAIPPAFAAEYVIVRGPDKRCRVVERTRPLEKGVILVGRKVFVTEAEAVKRVKVICRV